MIEHFANSLVKQASSFREELERGQRDDAFNAYMQSVREKEPKSFAKGFLAGAALPSLLSLTSINSPEHRASFNKMKERHYHGSLAFQAAGLPKDTAKEMAVGLDRMYSMSGIKGKGGKPLESELKAATKSLIQQQLIGELPISSNLKNTTIKQPGWAGVFKDKITVTEMANGLRASGLDPDNVSAVADQIMKENFPEIVKGKASLLSTKEYSDLLELGKSVAEKGKKPYRQSKTTLNNLGRFIKGNSKMPFIFGLVGGIGAVASTRKRKKEHDALRRKVYATR